MTLVGVLGGGQLARMLALAGAPLDIELLCVEPGPDPPAAPVAEVLAAAYGDDTVLAELGRRCDVVTVELEHVPVDALERLATRVLVRPGAAAVGTIQDRLLEKQALVAAGIRTAPYAPPDVRPHGFPAGSIVKRRVGGYDGRGQVRVAPGEDVSLAVAALGGSCIVEEVVTFTRELSIVAARDVDGRIACYPLVENRHRDGILRETIAPAPGVGPAEQAEAEALAVRLLVSLRYVGVLAVELFEVHGDDGRQLVANEVAPRVHNSGHWTIEGAVTSQFEQHLRAICGLPLGDPSPVGTSAMVNLVGRLADPSTVLAIPGAHLHHYGKAPRPGRKVGHVTVVGRNGDERDECLARVREALGPDDG